MKRSRGSPLILAPGASSLTVLECESSLMGGEDTSNQFYRTRRNNESVIIARSEKDVFEILGLPHIHPTMRNADA